MKINFYHKEIRSLVKSFSYAFRGLWFCIRNERNMRIHIVSSVLVLLFSLIYGLTRVELAVLSVTLGLVMMCELINTAIEALVNLESPSYDNLARIAKDVAAGAVLVCAFAAVGVAIALFLRPAKLAAAIATILGTPMYTMGFLLIFVVGLVFIFKGPKRERPNRDAVKVYRPENRRKRRLHDEIPGTHKKR